MSFIGLNKRSTLVALVVTVLAIVVLVKLGLWQIDRGQEKQAIIDQHASALSRGPQTLSQSLIDAADLQTDDQVQVRGEFEAGQYFLLDNQIYAGRVGYHVIGLLTSPQLTQRLAVNLGWVALPGGRDTLPDVEMPAGTVNIVGRVHYPAERPFLLREQSFTATLPQRIQYLELAAINQQMNLDLVPFSVLLDESQDIGFAREWPVVVSEPHRHYAYAVQWFGLAIAALVIFLIASRRAPKSKQTTK
ncbi:MAG: SURF1 family protein [Gammaproteobacteria bacterium]|nr:SURF1 family protein [Gammaproteobacteria bacterium]